MTIEEIDKLKETLDIAIENMKSQTWHLQELLDNFMEHVNDAQTEIDELPAEDLNFLLIKGFIPGVKFKYNDAEYQFKRYTETGRMEFINAKGESRFGDISSCRKMLDRFTMLKDNEQEGTDK